MKPVKYNLVPRLRMRIKFLLILFLFLLSITVLMMMTIHIFLTKEQQQGDNIESLAVTASDQYLEMTIESGVAIATSLYVNDSLYQFLNTDYKSSAAYFVAYRKLLKGNPLAIADTNIIDNFKIYTGNTTIMDGNDFRSLQSVRNSDWYKTFNKLGKSMILYCDASDGTLSLIRKLDYYHSDVIENYLKLDLNTSLFVNYSDNIKFDGKLYVINGGTILYSNQPLSGRPDITQEFYSFTKNYYTIDIKYYALAEQATLTEVFLQEWIFVILFFFCFLGTVFTGILYLRDICQRTQKAIIAYQKNGSLSDFPLQGCDEISKLTELGISLSDKLALRNSQYQRSQEQFRQKNMEYCDLFGQALQLDAILQMFRKYPVADNTIHAEWHSLRSELVILHTCRNGIVMPERISDNWNVPVYALILTADALCIDDNALVLSCDETSFSLTAKVTLHQAHMLKLQAIFEEGEVNQNYLFKQDCQYNAYLRLKHCFGSRVTLLTENNLTIRIQF